MHRPDQSKGQKSTDRLDVTGEGSTTGGRVVVKRGKKRGPRRLLWVFGLFSVFLVSGFFILRSNLPHLTETLLGYFLGVSVEFESIDISLAHDTVVFDQPRIGQPDEGFGDRPMFAAESLSIVGWKSLFSDRRLLKEVRISDLKWDLATDKDGRTNLGAWIDLMSSRSDSEPETDPVPQDWTLRIEDLSVEPVEILRSDFSVSIGGYTLSAVNGVLNVQDLVVGPLEDATPGSLDFSCDIQQLDSDNAKLLITGRFGRFGVGDPDIIYAGRLTGCLFRTLVPVIPSTTDMVLGGEGFDLDWEYGETGGRFLGFGIVTSSTGESYPFRAHGTPDEPTYELHRSLASISKRMSGAAGRTLQVTLRSGTEVLVGTWDAAVVLGKGTLRATSSFFRGIGRYTRGLVSGNKDRKKAGVADMRSGMGREISDAFTETGNSIDASGRRAATALTSDSAFQQWMDQIEARHETRAVEAKVRVADEEFPPTLP